MKRYKHYTAILASLIFIVSAASSEERFRSVLKADLNGDGTKETVRLIPYKVGETELGQLVVEDSKGKQLWKAPRSKDAFGDDPFSFLGEFDRGDFEFIGDFDQDGKVDLVATEQKSDVRPTVYKIFHWDGHQFVFDKSAMLTPDTKKRDKNGHTYSFKKFDPAAVVWVERIQRNNNGGFELAVSDLTPDSNGNFKYSAVWKTKKNHFLAK